MDLFGHFTQLIKNLTRNQPSTFLKDFLSGTSGGGTPPHVTNLMHLIVIEIEAVVAARFPNCQPL